MTSKPRKKPLPPPPPREPPRDPLPAFAHLECCMCGELLVGHDGKGKCVDCGDGDRICEPCYNVASDLLELLIPMYETVRDVIQERRVKALKQLIRVLMRTGHKARVRVRQHEEQTHS